MAACATKLCDADRLAALPSYNETSQYPVSAGSRVLPRYENCRNAVISALEKKGYYWRAVDSIARETGLQQAEVRAELQDLIREGIVVRAPRKDARGRVLYTTRKHYRETRGFLTKLASALANQIL
jgi:transcription initiation factor IIE alpha subunit